MSMDRRGTMGKSDFWIASSKSKSGTKMYHLHIYVRYE